jgi:hypothetical protein
MADAIEQFLNSSLPDTIETKDILSLWNTMSKKGDLMYHPRKPNPQSKLYTKLTNNFPQHFPTDPQPFTFTLMMIIYFVLKLINPQLPEYDFFEPICLVGSWAEELKQNYVIKAELRNLLKWHFQPVGCTEHSLFDEVKHMRIPLPKEPTRWTTKILKTYEQNEKFNEYLMFDKKDIVYADDKRVTFTFKEPLKSIITNHFKRKDKNFIFKTTTSGNLLELFLRFLKEEPKTLNKQNPNFIICSEGTLLNNVFKPAKFVHMGEVLMALWQEIELQFPSDYPPHKKLILTAAKNEHPAFVANMVNKKRNKKTNFF